MNAPIRVGLVEKQRVGICAFTEAETPFWRNFRHWLHRKLPPPPPPPRKKTQNPSGTATDDNYVKRIFPFQCSYMSHVTGPELKRYYKFVYSITGVLTKARPGKYSYHKKYSHWNSLYASHLFLHRRRVCVCTITQNIAQCGWI